MISISELYLVIAVTAASILVGHPSVLLMVNVIRGRPTRKEFIEPTVSVVIPTFNEKHVIESKIANTLSLDYPSDKMEIIVVDSGSTDGTPTLVSQLASVRLVTEDERRGEAAAVNLGMAAATGDIIVLTDADAFLERKSISHLVANFADPRVGLVTGRKITMSPGSSDRRIGETHHTFSSLLGNELLRDLESRIDSTSQASGELLAWPRTLIDYVPPDCPGEDYYLLLVIRGKNYRCIWEKNAIVYEEPPQSAIGQFARLRSYAGGRFYIVSRWGRGLLHLKYGLFGLFILPMSLVRFILLPICLLLLLVLTPVFLIAHAESLVPCLLVLGTGIPLAYTCRAGRRLIRTLAYGPFASIAVLAGILDFVTKRSRSPIWPKFKSLRFNYAWPWETS